MQKFYLLTNSFTAWRLTMIFAQMRPLTLFNLEITRKLNAFVKLEKGQNRSKCKQKCLIILVRPYFFSWHLRRQFWSQVPQSSDDWKLTKFFAQKRDKRVSLRSTFVNLTERKILFDVLLVLFTSFWKSRETETLIGVLPELKNM